MSDSSDADKDYDVAVTYGGKDDTLYIRAQNKKAAEELAAEALSRRRKKPNTGVVGAKEKQKKS